MRRVAGRAAAGEGQRSRRPDADDPGSGAASEPEAWKKVIADAGIRLA